MTVTEAVPDDPAAVRGIGRETGYVGQRVAVERHHGRGALARLAGELAALADTCAAPFTAALPWQLAAGAAWADHRPWALVARDERGIAVGAVVLIDVMGGRRALMTTLAGTDGGHRGRVLTEDVDVAHALGVGLLLALGEQRNPPAVLGPLPSGDPVVEAFAAGLVGSQVEPQPAVPVIRRVPPGDGDYLSAGMRRTLRKAANRLAADGFETAVRFSNDEAEILRLLPQLEQVHRERDHLAGRISELDDEVSHLIRQHRIRFLAGSGALELATLHIDGELAAYTLGFVDRAAYRLLEGRFVSRWARYSPGRVLEAAVVERALADGSIATFDWMTAVAPESLLGQNDTDPMVVVRLDSNGRPTD